MIQLTIHFIQLLTNNFPSPIKDKTFPLTYWNTPTIAPKTFLVTADATSLKENIPRDDDIATLIHNHGGIQVYLTYKLSISPYSLQSSTSSLSTTFDFIDTHIHQILGTSMGTSMDLFIGKEERTIIVPFLHLIYFSKRFIGSTSFIFLSFHTQLETWIKSDKQSNAISPAPTKPFSV